MSVAMPADQAQDVRQESVQAGQDQARGGRLRDTAVTAAERNYSAWMHLSLFAAAALPVIPPAFILPLILWLIRRDKSTFIDDHGRELTNVIITGAIATVVLGFIPIVGWLPLGVWYVLTAVGVVRGALAAHRGEFFRYPMIFRFLS
jgi:uncharacterized Tic20 family protein